MTSRGEKSLIVELTPGPRPGLPYFLISGVGGHVLPLQPVAKCILRHQGLGVIFPGFVDSESDYETVEDVAERMLRDIRAARPSGPYLFVGYSFGGIIGLEMASRLSVEGEKVGLVLLDSQHRMVGRKRSLPGMALALARAVVDKKYLRRKAKYLKPKIKDRLKRFGLFGAKPALKMSSVQQRFAQVRAAGWASIRSYRPHPTDVIAVLLRKAERSAVSIRSIDEPDYGWSRFLNLAGIVYVEGAHLEMFKAPYCEEFAREIETALDLLEAKMPPP